VAELTPAAWKAAQKNHDILGSLARPDRYARRGTYTDTLGLQNQTMVDCDAELF